MENNTEQRNLLERQQAIDKLKKRKRVVRRHARSNFNEDMKTLKVSDEDTLGFRINKQANKVKSFLTKGGQEESYSDREDVESKILNIISHDGKSIYPLMLAELQSKGLLKEAALVNKVLSGEDTKSNDYHIALKKIDDYLTESGDDPDISEHGEHDKEYSSWTLLTRSIKQL